jgi:CheY-like chemotaxis protein/GAF domain-containing protein
LDRKDLISGLSTHLLNAIGEGVALYSRAGQVLWANETMQGLGGTMQERLAGVCRQFDREHPLPPASVGKAGQRAAKAAREKATLVDDDRVYEVTATALGREGVAGAESLASELAGSLVLVLTDVTNTRRLQQKIDAIDMAGSELVRFDADVVRRHNAHERLKLLEDKIIKYASGLLRFDHFAIRLLDERSGRLELVIGHKLGEEYDSFLIKPALEGHGITGHVAASGRSYLCHDVTKDPLYLPGVEGAKSSLTIPLRVHDKVIGVMNVESMTPAVFTDEDRQLGEIFARYIALAINLLDLLVVERSTTNQTLSGRVAVELDEPLQDIAHEVEILQAQATAADVAVKSHLQRILTDLESIRNRVKECAAGPQSLLGVEKAMSDKTQDPLIRGKRVLVADDEPRIRRIIGDVLTTKGAVVTICEDGGSAMRAIEAAPTGFDLVISDIRMPDHNGYEVFAVAKKRSAGVPVILMTGFGYDPHHSIVRAHQEGLQSVLFKPFQVERLLDEVRKAVQPPAPPPPAAETES